WRGEIDLLNIYPHLTAAVAQGAFAASAVNEDAAHRLSGGGKEMGAPGELWVVVAHQPQPGFMHQRRGLQGISRGLIRHPGSCELAQLLINQREQFISRPGVAALDSL